MIAHSKLATAFGDFGSYPEEVILLVLEKCSYADMVALAKTNESMKTLIGSELKKKAFVRKWTRKQEDESMIEDCHTAVGQLLETVFGASDEGLSIMKTLLEAGFPSSKSFRGAGMMIGAYLNSQLRVDEQLVTKAFEIGWNLADGFMDAALESLFPHLETIDVFERISLELELELDDEVDEVDEQKIHYEQSLNAVYQINRHVARLLFFPTTAFIQRRLVAEFFSKARLAASNDAEQLASLLGIILSPGDPETERVDRYFYEKQDVETEEGRAALTNFALFWKILLDEVTHSAAEVSLLSRTFCRQPFASHSINMAVLLALEPSLVRFFLDDVSVLPHTAAHVLSTGLVFMHIEWHHDAAKLDDFRAVVEAARDESDEHNRQQLDELCDKVLQFSRLRALFCQAFGEESPDNNLFLSTFLELRR